MRPGTAALLQAGLFVAGCGGSSPVPPSGTSLSFAVEGQAESKVCEPPVAAEGTCTVTMTARVELGEIEGRSWNVSSVQGIVRDARSGQDLHAIPGELTAEDVRRLAGSNVLAAHGRLTIPLEMRFAVGQAPFYVDGPHDLKVVVIASGSP